jgi:hypothetical protein
MENNNSDIYIKFSTLPDNLKGEVVDFIEFLQNKYLSNQPKKTKRKAGLAKGMIKMKANFDEPLEDFKDYM